jgi:hypothetical protein
MNPGGEVHKPVHQPFQADDLEAAALSDTWWPVRAPIECGCRAIRIPLDRMRGTSLKLNPERRDQPN